MSPQRQRSTKCIDFCISLDTGIRRLRRFRLWFECKQRTLVARLIQKSIHIWLRGDDTVPNCWIKSLFCFISTQKVILLLHNSQIEPLIADGVSWRCFSYFSGPRQCYLLGSRWDSHKPPGSHPKYLELCSEDEQSIYGFGTIWG